MINKHNNISSQDALFNNVSIRDTLKSDSIEANEIIRSANPGSTGRIILNGTLTVLGNDNSIDTIKNVNITNNELQFTNETGTTTANKITQENGTTNITGGNITFNHTLKVTGDNNNVTTISDANIANNKEIEFINENGNTTIDNITGESTITNGNISFNNVVTVKNEQDNQNNITSIIDSNITNNKEINFTNQTANSLIDNITGESSINSGNISFDNLVTVKNQQNNQNNITSITDSNINNNNSMSFTNQTANTTIDNIIGESTITGGNITSNNVVTVKNEQNDNNNITSITNSTITNDNKIEFTNPTANTTIDTLQDGEGNLTITGGNITSNNIITVKNEQSDNNNITSITDSNLTNNNSLTFTKQTANTAIDNLQTGDGELTITGGNISFDNVVTIKNQQDNQNNITSITNSNINNNNSMSFTNETANTTIDTLQKGEGDLTITGGNINTNNIITVTDQSVITSLTNANITNSGTLTLNNASIDQLITSNINGHKTLNDSLKETKFKYKEETLKKSTDTVTGTKYYNIPYVKEIDNVTYYGELVNKTEELNTSHVNYDMKYYYADIIYYQYQNKIIIPENQSVNVNKADQISLVNADVTNNGTLNISDGSVIQEIIGDVKFSGKVNLEAVTEIRDVDNIILEEAIITNNKGINITGESTISSIIDSNIGGDVTIDTKGKVTVNNIVNSTITDGTITINDNITSTVTNSNLVGGTVNFGENKTLTVDVKAGTAENEIIKTITDSTINNAKVTLNNNITSTVTNSDLNATTINLNNNTLTTKEGITSSFNNIDNSTITNGDVLVNNNLTSTLTNAVLNNIANVDLNNHSLTANNGSTVSNINNSTVTNGNVTVNNNLDSLLTNSTLSNIANVNLNTKSLNAKTGSSVDNINNSTLTNGTVTINDNLDSSLVNATLSNITNVNLNTKSLNAKTGSSVSEINNSTITNGNVTVNNSLSSLLTDVSLNDIANVNLNSTTLTANNNSTVSNINNSTITNGNVLVKTNLTSSLANVTLSDIANVDLNSTTLTAKNESTVSNINNSTITNGNVSINNSLNTSLANVVLGDNVNNDVKVNLNSNTLTANNGSSVSEINKSTITNGTVTIKNELNSSLANVVLGDNVNNDVKVNLNSNTLTANNGSSISEINKSTITNGTVTIKENLTTSLANVVLGDNENNNVNVDLNTKSLNAATGSSISDIKKSTITNGTVTINENLSSLLTDVALGDNVTVNLSNNSLNATTVSSISNINNSTLTNGTLTINNDITSQVTNSSIENGTVDLNNHKLTANGDITLINITGGVITNTGTLEANGTITANQINSNLLKDQTGTNQIMAYDKDNKKITFCNHTTLTCSGTEDTLTTDNLVIDRITLNEVREVDGGIITTGLKVGFPYWTDLGTTEQGTTINIEGNILHVVKVLVDGVNHYQLWVSMMDIEFSLKSTETKIITKGTTFEGSVLINSLDDLTLGENEHLYIQSANVPIANGKMLNDMVINASINADGTIAGKSLQLNNASINNGVITGKSLQLDNASINTDGTIKGNLFNGKSLQLVNASISEDGTITGKSLHFDNASIGTNGVINENSLQLNNASINNGVITGKSLQTNQISNENGDKSIIKYESGSAGINPKITIGAENVDLEIIGFDQKNIVCDTLTASNYVKSNLLQSNDGKQIIKYEPAGTGTNPKITLGAENVDLEIVGFDQKNIACETLTASNHIQSDLLQSKDGNKSLIKYDSVNNKITLGDNNAELEIIGFDQKNINCDTLTASNYVQSNLLKSNNVQSNLLQSNDGNNNSIIKYEPAGIDTKPKITIGSEGVDLEIVGFDQKNIVCETLTATNRIKTDLIYSSNNNTPLIQLNDSTVTIGSQDKITSIYNLTVTNDLTVDNNIYLDKIYSKQSTTTPIFIYDSTNTTLSLGDSTTKTKITRLCTNTIADYSNNSVLFSYADSNHLEIGNANSNYFYTLIHKIKTNDPLYLSSIKYWISSTDSISLINYDPLTKTLTIGDSSIPTKQKTNDLTVDNGIYTNNIYSNETTTKPLLIYDLSNTVTIGSSNTTTKTNDLTITNNLKIGNITYTNSIYSNETTAKSLFSYDSLNTILTVGNDSVNTRINKLRTNTIANYLNNYVLFSYKDNYLELGNADSNYLYTLIHKIKTDDPLYISSLKYWVSSTDSISLINYDLSSNTITIGDSTKSTKQKTDNLTITTQLNTDLIKSSNDTMQIIKANSTDKTIRIGEINNTEISTYINTLFVDGNLRTDNVKSLTNAKNIISYSISGSTEKITIGSNSTTQETHNLTVTDSLTSSNQFYSDKMTSLTGSISLLNFSNDCLEVGSSEDSYNRTLVRKFRSNEPLGISSIYYWSSSDNTLSIPLLNYTTGTKTITLGNDTTNISIPGTVTSLKTNSIKDSENNSIISVNTGTITIGNDSSTQETKNLTVTNELRASNKFYSNTITSLTNDIPLLNYTTGTNTITLGNNTTTQKTNNLTVDTDLTVANRIYADSIYSHNNTEKPLIRSKESDYGVILGDYSSGKNFIYFSVVNCLYGYWNSTYQIFGEKGDTSAKDSYIGDSSYNYVFLGHPNYAYTLIHNLRTNEPLYTPSIYYWPLNTAKTSAIPLLVYDNTNPTITLGNTTTNISIPKTLITNSIKDSENDSIISVDTEQDIITIGNNNKQTIIKNVDYSDIFNKIYVSMGQNIRFKIESNPIGIDDVIKTVTLTTVTVTTSTGQSATYQNINAYQNADNIYNQYTTGQIFMATNTVTSLNEVYIIPKKRNLFSKPGDTGPFNTKQTALLCFVFCNLYFIIKTPTNGDETSSGLWTSSNGNVWYEFSPKDFNNQTGPYSEETVTGAKFDISLTETINSLSIGYIPRGWMTGYEEYEDHYVLGFPLSVTSYYAAFLLYDYDEYMTREVTYDGGCTIL